MTDAKYNTLLSEHLFLFVTANKNETLALLNCEDGFIDFKPNQQSKLSHDANFYNIGRFGCYNIVHLELIDQASARQAASVLSISNAIDAFRPDAVILLGVAFGSGDGETDKQLIGDVIISKTVTDYESGIIREGALLSDGAISEAGKFLVSVFNTFSRTWNFDLSKRQAKCFFGNVLSGDKFIDDFEFKSQLFKRYPLAYGGEMEGRGAYAACRDRDINEWIIIKGICDWGDGNTTHNKYENQIIAAKSTVSLLMHIFSDPNAFDKLPRNQRNYLKENSNINNVLIPSKEIVIGKDNTSEDRSQCNAQYANGKENKPIISSRLSYIDKVLPFIRADFMCFLNNNTPAFVDLFHKYSKLFSSISKLEHNKEEKEVDELLKELFEIIIRAKSQYILKIVGPTGSEKNAIMQLLFITLLNYINDNNQIQILPLLVDLNYYENLHYDSGKSFSDQITQQLFKLIEPYKNQCNQYPNMRRLIFISGIRTNQWSPKAIDCYLQDALKDIENLRFIVSVDTDLTANELRIRKDMTFASYNFSHQLTIESVDLSEENKAQRYLFDYEAIHGSVNNLYQKLIDMQFYSIDTYQLFVLNKKIHDRVDATGYRISDLYEAQCLEAFNWDNKLMREAAKAAYEFAYTDKEFDSIDCYTKPYWKLMRSHSSFTDFFISRYYMILLKEYHEDSSPNDFNMILPKTVTRFVLQQLNASPTDEERILKLCKSKYYEMGNRGRSEMTYWLGRIRSNRLKESAHDLLRSYYFDMLAHIDNKAKLSPYISQERKDDLFILRGIVVSLIYKQEPNISTEYIHSLLDDDLANMINRGFHLEYYGDKVYLPSQDTLDYEDDIDTGEKTLRHLIKATESVIGRHNYKDAPAFELNLFTICSLLQARIENPKKKTAVKINHFIERTIQILKTYDHSGYCQDERILLYFKSVHIDFEKYNHYKKKEVMSTQLYNKFSQAYHVKRTGWVDHGIPNPENIIEHSYNCWLMGVLLLPERIDEQASYSKQTILDMLLIHDLGECITGDIAKPEKENNPEYEIIEDTVMKTFLLKGTYPSVPNQSKNYDLWVEWQERNTLNARIAKEIDIIQTIYQLCVYLKKYLDNFADRKLTEWLNERNRIKTEIGKSIFRDVIEYNDEFNYIDFSKYLSGG